MHTTQLNDRKISVVIPAYNSAVTLDECLRHIFANGYADFEVIVVDDCSCDSTAAIARSYPCLVIGLKERRGPGYARWKGIEAATGAIVAFLDADCIAPPDWLQKINLKLTNGFAGIGGTYKIPKNSGIIAQLFQTCWDIRIALYGRSREVVTLFGGNCAFRKSILQRKRRKKELELFNQIAGGEDTIMCCELGQFGPLLYDPDINVIHQRNCSFPSLVRKTITAGYTGAIVVSKVGYLLRREPDRLYKAIVHIASIFTIALPFFAWKQYSFIILAVYLIVLAPLLITAHRLLSPKYLILLLPFAELSVDIMYLIGHLKRIFEVINNTFDVIIWRLKVFINILHPRRVSKIFFFVTKDCNAHCPFCFNRSEKQMYQEGNDLTIYEIEELTKKIKFLPFLTLTGGEPFLRKDLRQICGLFYQNCKTRLITVVSNGMQTGYIVDTVEKILLDFPKINLTVILALEGNKAVHDKIKGFLGSYEAALSTINQLAVLRQRFQRLTIGINTMLLGENKHNIKFFLEQLNEQVDYDRHAFNLLRQPANTSNEQLSISLKEYFTLAEAVNRRLAKKQPFLKKLFFTSFLKYCHEKALIEFNKKTPQSKCCAARKFFVINNQGDIYPCELIPEKIASLRSESFDFQKISNDGYSAKARRAIQEKNCYCQWPCAVVANTLFNIRSYPVLVKKAFRDAGQFIFSGKNYR
jgi:glycosyltransferase involved in cell wall biosynthesis